MQRSWMQYGSLFVSHMPSCTRHKRNKWVTGAAPIRFDTEKLIYEPLYELMDLHKLMSNFTYVASGGSSGNKVTLDAAYFEDYLKSLKLKNGFAMTILEFGTMNEQMTMMKQMSGELIASIDQEISE